MKRQVFEAVRTERQRNARRRRTRAFGTPRSMINAPHARGTIRRRERLERNLRHWRLCSLFDVLQARGARRIMVRRSLTPSNRNGAARR